MIISDKDALKELAALKATEFGIDKTDFEAMKTTGYLTSMLLELYDNASLQVQIARRESYTSTAENMDSLIKLGYPYKLDNHFATPSSMNVVISLYRGIPDAAKDYEFFGYATADGDSYTYIFKKEDTHIDVNGIPFSFDYDIEITVKRVVDSYSALQEYLYTAKFTEASTLDDHNNDYTNPLDINALNKNKPINIIETKAPDTGEALITLVINDIKQYIRLKGESRYYKENITEIKKFTFDNMIAEFNVFYRATDYATARTQLGKSQYYDKTDVNVETIYYKFTAANTLALINKKIGNFVPALNSLLDVEIYQTLGSAGNFNYTGSNVSLVHADLNVKNIVYIAQQPAGGKDSLTKEELRAKVILADSSRGSIITDDDLKLHYDMYKGVYKIDKTRHDFYAREYRICVALKDEVNNMYMNTNTLDLKVNLISDIDTNGKSANGRYYTLIDNEIFCYQAGRAYASSKTDDQVFHYRYKLPFILTYDKTNNAVEIYEKTVNRTYQIEKVSTRPETNYSYIVNRILFKKYVNFPYMLIFNLITSTQATDTTLKLHDYPTNPSTGQPDKTLGIVDTGQLKVRIVIRDRGVFLGYLEGKMLSYDETSLFYTYGVENFMDNVIYGDSVNITMKDKDGTVIAGLISINNLSMEVMCYDKNEGGVKNPSNTETTFTDDDILYYTWYNTFTINNIAFYKNLSYINTLTSVKDSENNITIKGVPMIGADHYMNTPDKVMELLEYEVDMLADLYEPTEQNYTQKLTLANTYGFSEKYKVGLNAEVTLYELAVSMTFKIKLSTGSTLTELDIMKIVKSEVMKLNFNNGDYLHINKIIKTLESTYPNDIIFIEFGGLNDLPPAYQYVALQTDASLKLKVPEILNIQHEFSYTLMDYIPNIYIQFI